MFATTIGATILFIILCALKGPPRGREAGFYLWPAATILIAIFSARDLKRSYREEPGNFAGFWHLSIADFYAVILFTGLLMAIFKSAAPEHFIRLGIALPMLSGFAYLFCLLLATRKGHTHSTSKFPCAFAYLLIGFGWMAIGAILIICIVFVLMREIGDLVRLFAIILGLTSERQFLDEGIIIALRIGLIGLPIGLIIRNMWS